jgi:hypothetical protein
MINLKVFPASPAAGVNTGSAALTELIVPAMAGVTVQLSVPLLEAEPSILLLPTHTKPELPASGAAFVGLTILLADAVQPLASVAVRVKVVAVPGFDLTVVFNVFGLVTNRAGDHEYVVAPVTETPVPKLYNGPEGQIDSSLIVI